MGRDRPSRWMAPVIALPLVAAASCGGSTGSASSAPTSMSSAPRSSASTARPAAATQAARCATADLTVALGAATTVATAQHRISVTFTNRSATRCVLYGYPGAQLLDAAGTSYDIVRSPLVNRTTVVLEPGGKAHAVLTYLTAVADSGPVFVPTRLAVTPPDDRSSAVVAWTYGPIVNQEAATHPGTYITAVAPGG
jgi:Protein of unknown function (DUF4232)